MGTIFSFLTQVIGKVETLAWIHIRHVDYTPTLTESLLGLIFLSQAGQVRLCGGPWPEPHYNACWGWRSHIQHYHISFLTGVMKWVSQRKQIATTGVSLEPSMRALTRPLTDTTQLFIPIVRANSNQEYDTYNAAGTRRLEKKKQPR